MATDNISKGELVSHTIKDVKVFVRQEDGYCYATGMCKAAGKKWHDFRRGIETNEYIQVVSLETGIPVSNLIETVKGRGKKQGTWVHPDIALYLAQWLDAEVAYAVTKIVKSWVSSRNEPLMQQPLALPDETRKHYWMSTDSSGKVIEQIELSDSGQVREQVDRYFPDAAVLIRDSVISDMDAITDTVLMTEAKLKKIMNPLITILGAGSNATPADADAFWKQRVKEAGRQLAELS